MSVLTEERGIVETLVRHRGLLFEMTRQELTERHRGQVLGSLWVVGHPFIQILVFIVLYSFIFKVRIANLPGAPADYTGYILSGLIPWLAVQDSLSRSVQAILKKANLVKQVIFPVEILPVSAVLVPLVAEAIGFGAWAIYMLVNYHRLPTTALLLPVLIFLQVIMMCGLAYAFSSVGVYLKDLKDVIQVFLSVGAYAAPIVYIEAWMPDAIRPLLYLNPFSYMIWCFQDALSYGDIVHPWAWVVFVTGSFVCLFAGLRIFTLLRSRFGSVL